MRQKLFNFEQVNRWPVAVAIFLVSLMPRLISAQQLEFKTKDGRFSTTGRLVEVLQYGKPLDLEDFVEVTSAGVEIVVLKTDSSRTKPISTSILADETLEALKVYLRQVRLHRKNHQRVSEILKNYVQERLEARTAYSKFIDAGTATQDELAEWSKWSLFDQFEPLYLTAAAELDAEALEYLKKVYAPAASKQKGIEEHKILRSIQSADRWIELYDDPSSASKEEREQFEEAFKQIGAELQAHGLEVPSDGSDPVKTVVNVIFEGLANAANDDLLGVHKSMSLTQAVVGLRNRENKSVEYKAVQSRLMLVAKAWDEGDFSGISEEATALRLHREGTNLIHEVLIKSQAINKESRSKLQSMKKYTEEEWDEITQEQKLENGGAEPYEAYALAAKIAKGRSAQASLDGDIANETFFNQVRLAIESYAVSGITNNGYRGKAELPDVHAEAIRILKEVIESLQ